jgi:hypothetical protein
LEREFDGFSELHGRKRAVVNGTGAGRGRFR